MANGPNSITLTRPDDWHLHIRDGVVMAAVLPATASVFGRAIIMPNLAPPIRNTAEAEAYRQRILAHLPNNHAFTPLMTLYLTDESDPEEIRRGKQSGSVTAVKLYPAGATTNSANGVTDIHKVTRVLDAMQDVDMPLLVHGEVTDPAVDIFDREARFIEQVLVPMRKQFPGLRIVLEHITTAEAVDYVLAAAPGLAATITPHHLMINRNALFQGGIRPHLYCLPVAKRERHRLALRQAATSGDPRFFLGTDSAPHLLQDKHSDCGCAGIFNAPTALACYVQVFDEEGALDRLEAFAAHHGPDFYQLPRNRDKVTLSRCATATAAPVDLAIGAQDQVRIFYPDEGLHWQLTDCTPAHH